MAKQTIDISTTQANGRQGEAPRTAFTKVNQNFDELYDADEQSLKKDQNLNDVTNAATARNNLGLGSAATGNVGNEVGQISVLGNVPTYCLDIDDPAQRGRWYVSIVTAGVKPSSNGMVNTFGNTNDAVNQEFLSIVGGSSTAVMPRFFRNKYGNNAWSPWAEIYHTFNTTVDSNGFIKNASPIIKLFSNSIEKTDQLEIAEVELERVDVGHYVLHNAPLLSRDGWYIETPKDRNGNIYFYLDYEEDEGGTLTIKTYEPDYSSGRAEAGAPMDIIDGRFVSLRFEEDPSLYPELEEPETEEE